MSISARIICDSRNVQGHRLTTFVLKYPRFIHSEIMTHRMFSRNAASSRAIPTKKFRERVATDPATPVYWGKNKPGMQASEELSDTAAIADWWNRCSQIVSELHEEGERLGCHKQLVNRVLEPFFNIEVVLTSEEAGLRNMFAQRCHADAQPEFKALADAMKAAYEAGTPIYVPNGEWHLPFITQEDREGAIAWAFEQEFEDVDNQATQLLKKISVGRCARVSYLNHEGKRVPKEDVDLHDKLYIADPPHLSPFEHVAKAAIIERSHTNFHFWHQYRVDVHE